MNIKDTFVEVVFPLPLDRSFYYSVPETLKPSVVIGKRVIAPLGRRTAVGYITGIRDEVEVSGLKEIFDIIDDEPLFNKKRLSLYKNLSTYYITPLGEVIKTAHANELPPKEERRFSITDTGRLHIQKDGQKNPEGEILSFIAKHGKPSLNKISQAFKGMPVSAILSRLKRQGWISEERLIRGRRGLSRKGFVVYTGGMWGKDIDEKRAPLQSAILKRIKTDGEVSLDQIREEFPNPYPALKRLEEKGWIRLDYRDIQFPSNHASLPAKRWSPTKEQKLAIDEIKDALGRGGIFLLHGVTGSGKTEVYLRVMEEVIDRGRGVIFLAPEIALASRLSRLILSRFKRVALIHSGLTRKERFAQWMRIKRGEVDIVAGARSAVFAPLNDIGLIIIDEEHDPSYKQEEGFRYNARDVAYFISRLYSSVVILGSATPSIETYHAGMTGGIRLIELKKRVSNLPMPDVRIVDMRGGKEGILSPTLLSAIRDTIERGNQALLFLNRKGHSSFILCKDCGYVYRCPNCLISLTYYKIKRLMRCHYCGFSQDAPGVCNSCNSHRIFPMGLGIEKAMEEIERVLPGVRVAGMDREVARQGETVWDAFDRGEIQILIGTQIIAKGYHFPKITLVGVLSGDQHLNLPDFRATERTFQLLTQVGGRAGRGRNKGTVIIQTFNPEGYCSKKVATYDYKGFYMDEIRFREEAGYPPFSRLANIVWEGKDDGAVLNEAGRFKGMASRYKTSGVELLGPAPAFYRRLRGRYRWQMVIKGKDRNRLHRFLTSALKDYTPRKGVKITIDLDPVSLL